MIKVLSRQSLLDIAVQTAGSAEAAPALAAANDLSITGELEAGVEVKPVAAVDRYILGYYANNQLKPATAVTIDGVAGAGTAGEIEEGIEFWYIEYDFMVS